MLTWLVATAYRIYFPEKPLPLEKKVEPFLQRPIKSQEPVSIGAREIKENQRRTRQVRVDSLYSYTPGFSSGVPTDWLEQMWRRRN